MRKHYPLNSNGAEDAGKLPWIDGVPATGVEGSYPGQALFVDSEAEILSMIDLAGFVRNGSDLTQAMQAAARGIWLGQFGGTSAALSATLPNNVVVPSLQAGVRVRGIATSNYPGGGGTLALIGVGPNAASVLTCPIVGSDGVTPLAIGAWKAGQFLTFDIDASGNARFSGGNAGLTVTQSNPILYVRPNGSDTTGDGSSNDDAHAFATIQGAMNASIVKYATTGRTVVIQLGAVGSYAAPTAIPTGVAFQILGSTAAQASYVLTGTPASNAAGMIQVQGATLTLTGLRIVNGSGTVNTVAALYGGTVFLDRVTLDHAGSNTGADVASFPGGSITFNSPCYFASNSASAFLSLGGSISIISGVQLTLNGTNNYSVAVAAVFSCGTLSFNSGSSISGSGVSGVRFSVYGNGVINTFGGGANFIPGNAAGTQSTGGQYL